MGFDLAGYQVKERIHQGRKSVVYRAFGLDDGRKVIAKMPTAEYPDSASLERLQNEYALICQLEHPAIARPVELVAHGSSLALILEEAAGTTLREHLGGQPIALDDFFTIAIHVVDALKAVHDTRVIHKDINPTNIMVNPEDLSITLVDFDIASLLPRESPLAIADNYATALPLPAAQPAARARF